MISYGKLFQILTVLSAKNLALAEGTRMEAPTAPTGRIWGRSIPLPSGVGSERGGCVPYP